MRFLERNSKIISGATGVFPSRVPCGRFTWRAISGHCNGGPSRNFLRVTVDVHRHRGRELDNDADGQRGVTRARSRGRDGRGVCTARCCGRRPMTRVPGTGGGACRPTGPRRVWSAVTNGRRALHHCRSLRVASPSAYRSRGHPASLPRVPHAATLPTLASRHRSVCTKPHANVDVDRHTRRYRHGHPRRRRHRPTNDRRRPAAGKHSSLQCSRR